MTMTNNITKEKIKKEIDKWDPIGLLDIAPADEYSGEVDEIYNRLQKYNQTNEAVLAGVIFVVFVRKFGSLFTVKFGKNDCFEVARHILEV